MDRISEEERLNSILSQLDQTKGLNVSYPISMQTTLEFLASEGLIKMQIANDYADKPTCWACILPKGTIFMKSGGFIKQSKEKADIDKLTKEKLMIDVTNAENIYKSYPVTQKLAIASFIISLLLLLLKLLEALKLWPYNQ